MPRGGTRPGAGRPAQSYRTTPAETRALQLLAQMQGTDYGTHSPAYILRKIIFAELEDWIDFERNMGTLRPENETAADEIFSQCAEEEREERTAHE